MAKIAPFQAWRYAPERVALEKVVTQPYDKISPKLQEAYYEASPYNLVRIILGRRLAGDTESENVYMRAAASFRGWRESGVLRQDGEPSIYRYVQSFQVPGGQAQAERRGFIALGKIEEYAAGVVFRHEQTLAKPKADRLDLLRATRGHFGQIFMLYGGGGKVDAILDGAAAGKPDIEVRDEYGVAHRVWRVADASTIARVQEQMSDRKLIIADGHHRYETALTYRNERRQAGGTAASMPHDRERHAHAPHDHVMMTFVDMDCPGLVILPTHRVVSGLTDAVWAEFPAEVRKFFNVETVDPDVDAVRATEILCQAGHAGTALLAVTNKSAWLLHTPKAVGAHVFGNLSLRQQGLDVVQLHKCVLENCLRISEEAIREQTHVRYLREAREALAEVREGKAQAAFLMNPVRMGQVRDIAFAGEVLPQKSTDFYPKLLSGLTIYGLD